VDLDKPKVVFGQAIGHPDKIGNKLPCVLSGLKGPEGIFVSHQGRAVFFYCET